MGRHTRTALFGLPRSRTQPRRSRFLIGAGIAILLPTIGVVVGFNSSSAVDKSANLVKDPNFDDVANAWTVTSGASVSVVAGYDGSHALRITNTTTGPRTFAVNDKVNTVASTQVGVTYVASAWVRTTSGISAAIREGAWIKSTSVVAPKLASAWLKDSNWHQVTVSYRPDVAGATIDLNVLAWQLPGGASFDLSLPSLVAVSPNPGTTSPAPSSSVPASSAPASTKPVTPVPSTTRPSSTKPAPSSTAPSSTTGNPGGQTTPVAPTSTAPQTGLVFDDEFDGTSVNTKNWTVRNDTYLGYDRAYITSDSRNVAVSNGALAITAVPQKTSVYGMSFDYTTGYLDSINHFSQKYGRWVMRAKMPQAEGMWPAFWLRSNSNPGEIDILEAIGGLPQMTQQTLIKNTNSTAVKSTTVHNLTGSTTADWHVYGFSWSPTQMTWDIDGVVVKTVRSGDVDWYASSFADGVNIRLNLQVGGSMPKYFGHDVSGPAVASTFTIDYVRVYKG